MKFFEKCSESSEMPRKVVFGHFWKNAYFAYFCIICIFRMITCIIRHTETFNLYNNLPSSPQGDMEPCRNIFGKSEILPFFAENFLSYFSKKFSVKK